jgi:hypothetical protein
LLFTDDKNVFNEYFAHNLNVSDKLPLQDEGRFEFQKYNAKKAALANAFLNMGLIFIIVDTHYLPLCSILFQSYEKIEVIG